MDMHTDSYKSCQVNFSVLKRNHVYIIITCNYNVLYLPEITMVTSIIMCYVIVLLCTFCVVVVNKDVSSNCTIIAVNISNLFTLWPVPVYIFHVDEECYDLFLLISTVD